MRPRVWLIPHHRGWTYDATSTALCRYLVDRFEFRVAYKGELHVLKEWPADLYVDFWWKRNAIFRRLPVLKQVSSHRWQNHKHGRLTPEKLIKSHLINTLGAVVPSQRLHSLLHRSKTLTHVSICPKGFHPEIFHDYDMRRGSLAVGWAGSASHSDKNVWMLRSVEKTLRVADMCLTLREMGDFYNMIDVIAISSDAEGDPRTLIEGMASGCFPVTTNVGIVPELVRHKENGLIVKRNPRAFREAFDWCRANIDRVRAAGRENARTMLATRTWASVVSKWGDAFDTAILRWRKKHDRQQMAKQTLPDGTTGLDVE